MEKSNEARGPDTQRPDPRRSETGRRDRSPAIDDTKRHGAERTRSGQAGAGTPAQEAIRFVAPRGDR